MTTENEPIQNEEIVAEETTSTPEATEIAQETEVTKTEKLEAEITELKDKYLRLYADFENFRRRTAKEKLELISSANEELMKAVLPVVDDFERAMASFETVSEIAPLKEGVGLIYNKFSKTLEGKGLKPMVAKGEVPRWDSNSNKWVSNLQAEETIGGNQPKTSTPVVDPQEDDDTDSDLPF